MKHILITILGYFLFLANIAFSQNVVLEVNNARGLYYGYNNLVEFATTDGRDFELISENAQIIDTVFMESFRFSNRKNTKTIIPLAMRDVRVLMVDPKSKLVFDTILFDVKGLPDPEIYWGSTPNGGKVQRYELLLRAMYPPEIPLNNCWEIISWELIFPELAKPFTGTGNDISGAEEAIKKLTFGEKVKVSCTIKGPDGTLRRISAAFNF